MLSDPLCSVGSDERDDWNEDSEEEKKVINDCSEPEQEDSLGVSDKDNQMLMPRRHDRLLIPESRGK